MDLGELLVGVRSNAPRLVEEMRSVLTLPLYEGLEGPMAYTIAEQVDQGRGVRLLHSAWFGQCELVRAADLPTLVRAVAQSAASMLTPPEGLVVVDAVAVVGEHGAVLGPQLLSQRMGELRPLVRRAGLAWAVGDRALLDLASRELVVLDVGIVDRESTSTRELRLVPPGRYPLAGWLAWLPESPDAGDVRAVREFLSGMRRGPWLDATSFLQAVDLVLELPRLERVGQPAEIVAAMASLARGVS